MKRCEVCHVETELIDGRCNSCRAAKEATDRGMSYGNLMANRIIEIVVTPPKYRELRKECKWCGSLFEPRNAHQRYCTDYCYRAANKARSQAKMAEKMS